MDQDVQLVNIIIDPDSKFQVSARGLWKFLELQYTFRQWFAYQCGAARLVEGEDFIEFRIKDSTKLGRPEKDFLLTRRAAYEIGMLNQGDKGKEIRNKFIDAKEQNDSFNKLTPHKENLEIYDIAIGYLERELKVYSLLGALKDCPSRAMTEAVKSVYKKTGMDFSEQLMLSPEMKSIPESQLMLEPTALGYKLGLNQKTKTGADSKKLTAMACNALLEAAGLQMWNGTMWEPVGYGKEISELHPTKMPGNPKEVFNRIWHVEKTIAYLSDNRILKKPANEK